MHNDRRTTNWVKGGCEAHMAPSVENEDAPKAPEESKGPKDKAEEEQAVNDLDVCELRGLLDEALNYRNPKDRVGKSQLFNHMLDVAEEDERNARAARAGGSELVRYCNPSAKKNRHNNTNRNKKQHSVAETNKHGGSLNNLTNEELFETCKLPMRKTVSARQREGGSLPCNVNAATVANLECQFLEEARKKKMYEENSGLHNAGAHDLEAESLLKHDCLDRDYRETHIDIQHLGAPIKYLSRATVQVNQVNNVDDAIQMPFLEPKMSHNSTVVTSSSKSAGGAPLTLPRVSTTTASSKSPLLMLSESQTNKVVASAFAYNELDAASMLRHHQPLQLQHHQLRITDENGNALQQNSAGAATVAPSTGGKVNKKKKLTDKNVVVCRAENVEGHRSDIINDMAKLMEFLGENRPDRGGGAAVNKSKLNRHSSGDDTSAKTKKQRSNKSKSSETDAATTLTKSNSLGEISKANRDAEFQFENKSKVLVLRGNTAAVEGKKATEKGSRERRSWGNMEDALYASTENLESSSSSAEFRVVTKKKKSRKRRNSMSASGSKATLKHETIGHGRAPSPDLRRKSACSVPHSEKSNDDDSSDEDDVDSVHSLPIDTTRHHHHHRNHHHHHRNHHLSYAEMAKNADSGGKKSDIVNKNNGQCVAIAAPPPTQPSTITPPDVSNVKSFPAIKPEKNAPKDSKPPQSASGMNNNNRVMIVKTKLQQSPPQTLQMTNDFALLTSTELHYTPCRMPPDIPDVQTIEKQQLSSCYEDHRTRTTNNTEVLPLPPKDCDNNNKVEQQQRHLHDDSKTKVLAENHRILDTDNNNSGSSNRPAVVILSGLGSNKEVPGLIFGFDINEQLLNDNLNGTIETEEEETMCCEQFVMRYIAPESFTQASHNHDKIVAYLNTAWEDVLMNVSNGKVKYYAELL